MLQRIFKTWLVTCVILHTLSLDLYAQKKLGIKSKILPTDYKLMHASEIGMQLFGVILNEKNPNESVILIKITSSNKTDAKKIGHILELEKSYKVIAIGANYVDLHEANQTLRVYKDGFAIPSIPFVISAPTPVMLGITDSYKENGFEREKGAIRMTEEYRKKIIEKDLPDILMQASAEPVTDANGNILGFLIDQIDPGSIYAKSGIQNGDIIKSINGDELNNIPATIKLLHSLKNSDNIDLEISRAGMNIPMNIKVQK